MTTRATLRGKTGRHQQGHTVVFALVLAFVMGVGLICILKLATSEGQMNGRSQNWNAVIPIVEAGIEEALTHLRYAPTNRDVNGWTFDATENGYTRRREFSDGYYHVIISTNYDPVITSRAGLRAPRQTQYSIHRAVRVQATNQPLFTSAMEGVTGLRFNGNNVRIDSYDSRDPNHSLPNGAYNPKAPKAGGDVVSYGAAGSLDIGNANVYGMVKTGPDASYKMGPNGSAGSLGWNQNGVQSGWNEEVPETEYPPITPPPGGTTPPAGTGPYKDYRYVLTNGVYELRSLTESIVVTGDATLLVTEALFLSGKNTIKIEPGGKLRLFVAAADASFSGVSDANPKSEALNFIYYGLPSNRSLSISGNGAFCGVVYAPSAMISLNGGGNNSTDFSGAIIANHVTVNGHFNFHFDEATRRFGSRGIVASSWDEI